MVMDIDIYLDGADLSAMATHADNVAGFTTNPSLARKAGITNYREFARTAIAIAGKKPISLEVFADDFAGMERQAREIASWGANVYVKIPITNTAGESSIPLIEKLADARIHLNITAILTHEQIKAATRAVEETQAIISVFAGRIADTGRDPVKTMRYAANIARSGWTKVLWASTREVYNVVQADEIGCDIITCSPDIIAKLGGLGRDLGAVSLDTVKQFYADGKGFSI